MTRLTLTFAALLCSLSVATAALSRHADFTALGNDALPSTLKNHPPALDRTVLAAPVRDAVKPHSFEVTDGTDVRLDGQSCKLQDVPSSATIVSVELEADGKTVLKIHFKSNRMSGVNR